MSDFIERLEKKVFQQLASRRVGYLLGAGSSFLGGGGYPLAAGLWEKISDAVPAMERADIQAKLDDGASGIEHALDLLDKGGVNETPHRHLVTDAIADAFQAIVPITETHVQFLLRISKRQEHSIPVFSLNYDPLIEWAADAARVRTLDGFEGFEKAFFNPGAFQLSTGVVQRGLRLPQFRPVYGTIHLLKLHGSLGWQGDGERAWRSAFCAKPPAGSMRLMIPPQYRKATDTMQQPYAALWSEFRAHLRHGPHLVNRLACIGYGMCDEHVNAVLDNALVRRDFTLLIFARDLSDECFARWSAQGNTIVVTQNACSLYSETGEGHEDLWSFERLAYEV